MAKVRNFVDGLRVALGVDRAVLLTICARGWSVASGIVTIWVITKFLSPELQGYYYTFSSLIALQIFAELGLTVAIVQFASHEMAGLLWNRTLQLVGQERAKQRLGSLLRFAFIWFGASAVIVMCVLLPLGLWYFHRTQVGVRVTAPWVLLVVSAALNLFLTAAVAVVEGCGRVADVALLRLCQAVITVSSIWFVLAGGWGLYALPVSALLSGLTCASWLISRYGAAFKDLFKAAQHGTGMKWREEIWPFQWRIGVSWISGYFIFQLFTPLLFATHGAVVAGKMGMSMQVYGALNSAAMAWIATKVPTYGQLAAKGLRKELDSLFLRGLIQSALFLTLCLAACGLVLAWLIRAGSVYPDRLLSPPLLGLLAVSCLTNHIVYAQASYLRAHKIEPFMWPSVAGGALTFVLAVVLVPPYGALGAVISYVTAAIIVGLVWGTLVFLYSRDRLSRAAVSGDASSC